MRKWAESIYSTEIKDYLGMRLLLSKITTVMLVSTIMIEMAIQSTKMSNWTERMRKKTKNLKKQNRNKNQRNKYRKNNLYLKI